MHLREPEQPTGSDGEAGHEHRLEAEAGDNGALAPAVRTIPPASGRYARPALSAENPSTSCMYNETKKNMENSAAAIKTADTLMPVIVRIRKMPGNGTSGSFWRRSIR